MRVFEIKLVELTSLTDISVINQEFKAQFYIEFRVVGGAIDPDFSKDGNAFPIVDGKPTFRPPAGYARKGSNPGLALCALTCPVFEPLYGQLVPRPIRLQQRGELDEA